MMASEQQFRYKQCTAFNNMFQIIEHQQYLLIPNALLEPFNRWFTFRFRETKRLNDTQCYQTRIFERGQGNKENAIRKIGKCFSCNFQTQAGFANSWWTNQRDEADTNIR